MNKQKLFTLGVLCLGSATVFAAKERVIKVQNHVRVGYDDNVYASENREEDSAFITDIVNISAKINFSSRTDMLLYYQPEVRYWLDVSGDDVVTYQDLYGRLNHAISQRTFLMISDRFRYQQNDGQASDNRSVDNTFYENDLMGAVDYTINSVSQVKVGAGYKFRVWEDDQYGEWQRNAASLQAAGGNNYGQFTLDGSYIRDLNPNKTKGLLGARLFDLEYDGQRGGYSAVTVYGGLDQNFSPNLTGFARGGFTSSTVEKYLRSDEDSTTPYAETGLEYNPSARTSLNGTLGYTIANSDNSGYNASKQFSMGFGVRQDLTAKISLASTLKFNFNQYDSEFSSGTQGFLAQLPDEEEVYINWNLRASYQINRNNFLEAGYSYADRSVDKGVLSEYTRNRVDFGWRLRL
jgi:hypothetical protein